MSNIFLSVVVIKTLGSWFAFMQQDGQYFSIYKDLFKVSTHAQLSSSCCTRVCCTAAALNKKINTCIVCVLSLCGVMLNYIFQGQEIRNKSIFEAIYLRCHMNVCSYTVTIFNQKCHAQIGPCIAKITYIY